VNYFKKEPGLGGDARPEKKGREPQGKEKPYGNHMGGRDPMPLYHEERKKTLVQKKKVIISGNHGSGVFWSTTEGVFHHRRQVEKKKNLKGGGMRGCRGQSLTEGGGVTGGGPSLSELEKNQQKK